MYMYIYIYIYIYVCMYMYTNYADDNTTFSFGDTPQHIVTFQGNAAENCLNGLPAVTRKY